MEHMPSAQADQFAEMHAGTAADHYMLGLSHIKHAMKLTIFGSSAGGSRPHTGADVHDRGAEPDAGGTLQEENPAKAATNGVFLPIHAWKEVWDLWVLMLILYSAVMVPYRICFSATAVGLMFIFEQAITVSFITDVCFNFNTAYFDNEKWVTDRGKISARYLSGWFWIDAPSSFPVELVDMFMEGDSSTLGMLKFLRLFRLLRLLRLLKMGEYIATLEIKFDVNLTFLRILQMVSNMIFLAHMLGCFWFYMAAIKGLDPDIVTWVSSYDDGSGLDADPQRQYLFSVYWALTTLTTVGYGDITPTNDLERSYSLFALLLGALVFGFMLSSIGSLVQAIDRQAAITENMMDEVKEYMRWRRLPRDLVMRIRRYYTYYYSRKTAFDEEQILGALTPGLRFEVIEHTLKETIGQIPLFAKTLDPLFQMEIFPLLKPLSAAPKEIIFNKGEESSSLLFLIKGSVEVISGVDGRVLYRIRQGSFFGESVLTGRRRSATHRAAMACEFLLLTRDALTELFARRPREGKLIHQTVMREHVRKERMRGISLRLLLNSMGPGMALEAAALRVQIAWNQVQDRLHFKLSHFDPDESDMPHDMQPATVAKAVLPPGIEAPEAPMTIRGGAMHASYDSGDTSLGARLAKLDRLDPILAKLEALTRSMPISERGGKTVFKGRG